MVSSKIVIAEIKFKFWLPTRPCTPDFKNDKFKINIQRSAWIHCLPIYLLCGYKNCPFDR